MANTLYIRILYRKSRGKLLPRSRYVAVSRGPQSFDCRTGNVNQGQGGVAGWWSAQNTLVLTVNDCVHLGHLWHRQMVYAMNNITGLAHAQ